MTRFNLNKQEWSWVLYDVANSAYTLLAATLIPIYFASLAEPGSSVVIAWGYTETIASLIMALLMPLLGSLADIRGNKKKFFVGFVGVGATACAALGFQQHALPFLIIYVICSVAMSGSCVFYDAFLVDTTTPDRFDHVSSNGYAWGYIGSFIPFIICLALVLGGGIIGIDAALGMKISFFITAVWCVIFTIPLLRNVRQVHFKDPTKHPIRSSLHGLISTIKKIVNNRQMLLFMIAYFFYIDGMYTIFSMSTSYATDLGIDASQLLPIFLVSQTFVAFPATLAYGKLASKYGTRKMILIAVGAYFFITLFAAFCLRGIVEVWILGILIGLFQGGLQSLSRSEFGKLVPKEQSNEYFGFFDIFGKYAAIMGTFLMSFFTQLSGNPSIGILSVAALFLVGFFFMCRVPQD